MEGNKITYHQQVSFCGKARCRRCREGIGHGPYWYAYQTVNGRTVRTYIGKEAPAEVLAAQTDGGGSSQEFANTLLRLYVLGQFRLEQRSETPANATPQPVRSTTRSAAKKSADATEATTSARSAVAAAAGIRWEAVTDASLQHQRVRSLLSCLVSSPGRKLAREQVMYTLWPELDMETASHRLDRAVHSLRQAFEPGRSRPATSKLLLTEHSTLALADQAQFWVDADAFENLIVRARGVLESDPGQAEQLLEEATQLYSGDFMPDENTIEWVQSRRESLRRAWISLLLELADLRIAREAIPGAIDTLDRLLTADPANEAAVQRLVTLLSQMGRRGEAIQAYQRFASVLRQDYKITPLPETRTLYENVLHGRATLTPTNGSQAPTRETASANGAHPAVDPTHSSASIPTVVPSHMYIGRTQQSPLVGRDEEIARLQQLLQITEQTRRMKLAGQKKSSLLTPMDVNTPRRQQCVMLMGDVGIGKTRLAEEAAREAKRRNWAVAWCRAYIQESSVPYRLWTETLRKAMSQGLWQRQEVSKRPLIYQPLRALLPELADLLPLALQQMPPPPEQEQLRLWESTRALLSTICENTTLLIVLDDLQWADSSSCELLTYLVRQMRGMPVMFLCTCRDTELPTGHPLRGLLTDLQREQAIEQIPVKPLSDTEISQLIGHLAEPLARSVSSRASGNPFFAEELARGITANAMDVTFDPAKPDLLPDTIQAVLELRLARITKECRSLLERGAVLGSEFPFETIRDMASGGALADEDLILDLIEEGLQAHMLTEDGSGMNIKYHLWHPLLQSYLYEHLSAARKASLHRKAAQVLQTLFADREAEGAAEIADHLVKGGSPPTLTARYAELAADRAYSLSAYPDAEKYYRLTLKYAGDLAATASQEERLHYAYVLEKLGESMIVLGKFEDARKFYEQVLELRSKCVFTSEEEQKYEAQLRALFWCEIGKTWHHVGESVKASENFKQGEIVLNDAKVVAGPAWAIISYEESYNCWQNGNLNEAFNLANKALELFEDFLAQPGKPENFIPSTRARRTLNGDPVDLGRVYTLLALLEMTIGQLSDALNHLNIALDTYEKYNCQREIAIVCSNQGDIYLKKAEYTLAQTAFNRTLSIAEQIGDIPTIVVCVGNLGIQSMRLGNLIESEAYYKRALFLAEQINNPFYTSFLHGYLTAVKREQGKIKEARESISKSLTTSRSAHNTFCLGFGLVGLGQLYIAQILAEKLKKKEIGNKQYKRLLEHTKAVLERALSFEELEAETKIEGRLALAEVALLSGELRIANQQASQTLKDAQECELIWLVAGSQRMLGHLLVMDKQPTEAEKYFQLALTTFHRTGMHLEYARTLRSWGSALLSTFNDHTNRQKALQHLEEAHQIFRDSQATLDIQNVEHLLTTFSSQPMQAIANSQQQRRRAH